MAPADREPVLGAEGSGAPGSHRRSSAGPQRCLPGRCRLLPRKLQPWENSDQPQAAWAGLFPLPSVPLPTQTSGGPRDLRTAEDSGVNSGGRVSSWTRDWSSRAPHPLAPPAPASPPRIPSSCGHLVLCPALPWGSQSKNLSAFFIPISESPSAAQRGRSPLPLFPAPCSHRGLRMGGCS